MFMDDRSFEINVGLREDLDMIFVKNFSVVVLWKM